ncbi:putative GTP binding protein [Aspergillus tanneri]|uniref:Uncharacterized protein n=1 Tax=Aspergillus tanneri TaxID=1220188 RepID=A0A5M9MXH3_9EURO|nr:uncharacterized protein ATNIH1004_002731 [Aspergillus tanneri]KAA8650050.1 hypothetical protein ATNIH1004_002731 [Aspergillus tanneri]
MSINRDADDIAPLNIQALNYEGVECPSLQEIISGLRPATVESVPNEPLSLAEQKSLFNSLQGIIKEADSTAADDAISDTEVPPSFQHVDTPFGGVKSILHQLLSCRSLYTARAAEVLANGSRNPSWRLPFGQTGILNFFLELVASKGNVDTTLLLHSLRLIGNCCADTDENRMAVVKDNYTAAILQHLLNSGLIQVVVPVIYNLCVDFEPAQTQLAANKIVYILLKLIKDDAFKANDALLNFAYELMELTMEQEQGIEASPDATVLFLIELATNEELTSTVSQFSCVANCLTSVLETKRFQDLCLSRRMLSNVLPVLTRAVMLGTNASNEDSQRLAQLQLKINQTLSEVSASPIFAENYPLGSSLSLVLKSWLATTDDQLRICSCVMLGNLARSDAVCERMVKEMGIHQGLISILNSRARGTVLHAALGFLKNLAIAGDNKLHLGAAGIIPAISRLWSYETFPQVQFAAVSIARQLVISSDENITRLLETCSADQDASSQELTYLTLLVSLFEKTDSIPIKIEIGRLVASICRTITPRAREQDQVAESLLERLFTLHKGVALPIGAMITQSQWSVVRSEGWFALALMAWSKQGSAAVAKCFQTMNLLSLLEETLGRQITDLDSEEENLQLIKDRDNTVILVQELLRNDVGQLKIPYYTSTVC